MDTSRYSYAGRGTVSSMTRLTALPRAAPGRRGSACPGLQLDEQSRKGTTGHRWWPDLRGPTWWLGPRCEVGQVTRSRSPRNLDPPTPHHMPKEASGGARDRRPTGFPQPHVRSATSQGLDRPQTLRQQIKTCRRREKWGEGNNKKIIRA